MTTRRALARPAVLAALALLAIGALTFTATRLTGGSGSEEIASPAVVRVTAGTEIATGFALNRDRIVTVAHALARPLRVDGRPARVLRVDRGADVALLSVPGLRNTEEGAPTVAGHSASARDDVRIVRLRSGHVASLRAHVRRAIVAHVRVRGAPVVTRPALELAARVAPGDSGAPVITKGGAIAGIIFAASNDRENTAYAVDASALVRLLGRG